MNSSDSRVVAVVLILSGLICFLWSEQALGKEGMDIKTFRPAQFGGSYLSIDDAATLPQLGYGFGLYYDYAPEQLTYFINGEPEFDAIEQMHSFHLNAAIGAFDWWSIALSLPLTTMRYREIEDFGVPEDRGKLKDSGLKAGDLFLGLKFAALQQDRHWISMAVSPFINFPTGDSDLHLSEGKVSGGGWLILDHDFNFLEVALNGGYLVRGKTDDVFGVEAGNVGNAFLYGIGLAKVFDFGLGLAVEYRGRQYEADDTDKLFNNPMEIMLVARYQFGDNLPRLTAGISQGMTNGVGTPSYRVVGGIDYFILPSDNRPGKLIVRTIDENNAPIKAKVTVVGPDGQPIELDSDGKMQVELRTGNYAVTASAEGRAFATRDVRIRNNKTRKVTLILSKLPAPQTGLNFIVVDACTDQKINCSLTLDDGTTLQLENGELIQDMKPRKYAATIAAQGYIQRTVTFEIGEGNILSVKKSLTPKTKIFDKAQVLFLRDSSTLSGQATITLDQTLEKINQLCGSATVLIQGHADPMEDRKDSELSKNRAQAVAQYLIDKGVNPSRLRIEGLNANRPIGPNAMEWGRRQNRRVEISVAH